MTIVVGYIDTPAGRAALDHAITEAERRNARLVVVHASRTDAYLDHTPAERALDKVRAQLEETGVEHEVRRLVRGREPADELIDVADEHDADLIVIGIRRRSPVGKLIMGSIAERILLDAHCPVLAVKADAEPKH
jgi:nucleotide-binding universal stress UspA family protein